MKMTLSEKPPHPGASLSKLPATTAGHPAASDPAAQASAGRARAASDPPSQPLRSDVVDSAPVVQVHDLHLYYGSNEALTGITMDFPRNQVTALIGPSGCGKSTLLALPEPDERLDRRRFRDRQHPPRWP